MANIPLTTQQIWAIIQLLEKRFSYRSISRDLKIHRKPITDYDKLFIASGLSYSALRQLSDEDLATFVFPRQGIDRTEDERYKDFTYRLGYFNTELKRTGVTRLLLWEEYRKEYPNGYGYTLYEEVMIGFGKNVDANVFDQNRLGILAGYVFSKNFRIEAGFLNQIQQLGRTVNNKAVFQYNNGPVVNLMVQTDLFIKK
jgi:hypothetical protein